MNNIENFKVFVKSNPSLANYIKEGTMTWQKFYELYDLYGEESSVWDEYKEPPKKSPTINEIVSLAKKIDINKLQDGVNSLSKAVGLFSDLISNKTTNTRSGYQPRAIYRRFDD